MPEGKIVQLKDKDGVNVYPVAYSTGGGGGGGAIYTAGEGIDIENDVITNTAPIWHDDIESSEDAGVAVINADQFDGYTLNQFLKMIYPVGSIYMNISNVNPSTFILNTTWELISNVALASEHVFGNGIAFGLTNNGSNKFALQAAQGGLQTSASGNFGKAVGTGTSGVQNLSVQVIGAPTKSQLGDDNLNGSGLISDTITLYTWKRTL